MQQENRVKEFRQEILVLLCWLLKSTDTECKTAYFGKLLFAEHAIRPSYFVLFLYMSSFILSFFLLSWRVGPSPLLYKEEEEHGDDILSIPPYSVQVWYKRFTTKIPLGGGGGGPFFSVNNNPHQNTWTGLLQELDRISKFHFHVFQKIESLYWWYVWGEV
jgi:hypothetical protein